MTEHPIPDAAPEPVSAASVSVSRCSCGTIYLRLHDRDGEIFAYGALPVETAVDLGAMLAAECEAALTGAPSKRECVH